MACLLGTVSFLVHPTVLPAETTTANAIVQREQIRRQEIVLRAIQDVESTESLIKEGKGEEAKTRLAEILKTIPQTGEGSPVYARASALLALIELDAARKARDEKDWFEARDRAIASLGHKPENAQASQILEEVNERLGIRDNDESTINPAVDRKFVKNLNKVQALMKLGRDQIGTGQLDAAEKSFSDVLVIDPYNKPAAIELNKLFIKRRTVARIGRESSRQERLTKTREGWTENTRTEKSVTDPTKLVQPIRRSNNFAISQKLTSIIIPQVDFSDATIADAATFITNRTRELDPEGTGVSVIVKNEGVNSSSKPFSLRLNNVPAGEVLRYITNLAGVKYRVDEFAVFIVPLTERTDVLVTREFPTRPSFFDVAPSASAGNQPAVNSRRTPVDSGDAARSGGSESIRSTLEARGVDFSTDGAAAFYNLSTGILTVKNTQDQIDLVEELVIGDTVEALVVKVDARVVEINQTDLNSLAINATLAANPTSIVASGGSSIGGGSVGASTGLQGASAIKPSDVISTLLGAGASAIDPASNATEPNKIGIGGFLDGNAFRALLEALSQKQSFDLMTAPSIIINDGAQGTITIAREFYYPTEFDEAQVTAATISSRTTVVPAWPSTFETRNVGVVLTAQPRITVDRQRVFLTLKPDITEFDGFINYGSRIFSTESDAFFGVPNGQVISNNVINQPVFSVRTVENAQMEIGDGQTMVLGGLIREDISTVEEKVPILGDIPLIGRAFRSKAEQAIKRNLLIFVTVRILRPDGEPYNLTPGQ
ncbi:MAG: hypothetical protein SFU85_03280 [Candidatus Methylacidiphilales bacterium]|nr:hypothetical protein [Candidatus Methylacidiphilales bacterium]